MLEITRLKAELGDIQAHLARVAAGPRGGDVLAPLRSSTGLTIPAGKLLWQALHGDCLRIVYVALVADEQIVDEEIDATYEYLFSVGRHYAEVLPATYGAHAALEPETSREFLTCYAGDTGPFGFKLATTRWAGLDACRRAAVIGDGEPLERYQRLIGWLCDEAVRIADGDGGSARVSSRLDEIHGLRRSLAERSQVPAPGTDLRLDAFLGGPRVFAGVTQADSVFDDDPFDVEEVHGDVRETFERLVSQAATPARHAERGRMMLVLGDSGAGKTHLMRAFRRVVHDGGHGFATYAQLQSRSNEYSRYLLHNVIESLERPYGGPSADSSGLLELSRGLPRMLGESMQQNIARLVDEDWPSPSTLAEYVNQLVDELLAQEELARFDPDLLRALLYLQRGDSRITPRVLKYLRCEPMNAHDRRWIGDVQPRVGADEPIWMIQQLARLAFTTQQAPFVLMVDQAELAGFNEGTIDAFKRAVDALYAIVSAVPSAVAVVACLGDMYTSASPHLSKSMVDRLEGDPPVARLAVGRTAPEIAAIVARRLAWLYGDAGAVFRPDDATFPIPAALLQSMTHRRTRSVLEVCHRFQEACSTAGRVLEDWLPSVGATPPAPATDGLGAGELDRLAADWNDTLHSAAIEVPDEDDAILALIEDAARACAVEADLPVEVRRRDACLDVDLGAGAAMHRLTIGIANKGYHRGAFAAQVTKLVDASRARVPTVVRTIEYPRGKVSDERVAALLKDGGRKALCTEPDLRALVAMRDFVAHRRGPALDAWRRRDRPLLARESLAHLFDLAALLAAPIEAPPVTASDGATQAQRAPDAVTTPAADGMGGREAPAAHSTAPPRDREALAIGTIASLDPRPYDLEPDVLARHSGVLGSPGSGKTTLALNIIEQLLERDVAVVLVDRKGDLAGYARPRWWEAVPDPEARRRAETLAERIDVRLFTPGTKAGRPLAFGVVPRLDGVPEHERGRLVTHAASALAAMMRFRAGSADQTRRAILAQAITVLAERMAPASLEHLIDLIESRDDALIARAGRFDDRLFKGLVTELETLRLNSSELFDRAAEQLSADLLLARGANGRTPLSIVSTRFLGDTERVQAWTSHLFVELSRWCMRAPQPHLQALVMLDEADQYMPASSKPPSKDPLMDLLKRSRSAGLGVMLATQTPGDLDYKSRDLITTWFIGKIGDSRSIGKVKPLLERKPALAGKLGQLPSGQFIAADDTNAFEIQRRPSLLRTDQLPEQEIATLARAGRG